MDTNMTKLKENISKGWDNYKKPTPTKWRKRGDISLLISFLLLVIDFVITWVGDIPGLSEHQAFYLTVFNIYSTVNLLSLLHVIKHLRSRTSKCSLT